MAIQLTRRRFTVDEYHRMAEAGILNEDDRVELVEGELFDMTPIGVRNARCVDSLTMLPSDRVSGAAIMRVQSPVRPDEDSEPQPDLALLKLRDYSHDRTHHGPSDVLLIIDVSDTTLAYDRIEKLPSYARAPIPEFWRLNLKEDNIDVYSRPSGYTYSEMRRVGRDRSLSIPGFPGATIPADEILR